MGILSQIAHAIGQSAIVRTAVVDPMVLCLDSQSRVARDYNTACACTGTTGAGLLDLLATIDPSTVCGYIDAWEAINSDIYGRWQDGALTNADIDAFKESLAVWELRAQELLDLAQHLNSLEDIHETETIIYGTNLSEP